MLGDWFSVIGYGQDPTGGLTTENRKYLAGLDTRFVAIVRSPEPGGREPMSQLTDRAIMTERFTTMRLDGSPEVTAPDGSAVSHATVEEIWFVTSGVGEMWRSQNGREEVTALEPGVSLTIPLGTTFQFRAGAQELRAVAVTVPPWPVDSPNEARFETGRW